MGIVYAIANQKGGVGKTTTAVNVAACIAEAGYDTLLVDVDPQGNATTGLGVERNGAPGLYGVLGGEVAALDAVRPTAIEHLSLLASTPDLAGATMELPRLPGSETRLRDALAGVRERFAYTLLDCPPSLGPLTVNALVAADRVIVPVQTEYFALEGLAGLLDTLSLVQRELNPRSRHWCSTR
jgi:chromosome partitioning protein